MNGNKVDNMEYVNCNLCGRDDTELLFTKKSVIDNRVYRIVKCKSCGLVYINPRLNELSLHELYQQYFEGDGYNFGYENYLESKGVVLKEIKLNLKDINMKKIEKNLKGRKLLEIGCATGVFLEFMRERCWVCYGIELSEFASKFARENLGLNVFTGTLFEANLPKNHFDMVAMWYLIEHLRNPKETLQEIKRVLSKNGVFVITTPRMGGGVNFMRLYGKNWRLFKVPEHLYYFSEKIISKMLYQTGFNVQKIVTFGSGMSTGRANPTIKKVGDFVAKKFNIGDTMLLYCTQK